MMMLIGATGLFFLGWFLGNSIGNQSGYRKGYRDAENKAPFNPDTKF
jgi:hypothetical protein